MIVSELDMDPEWVSVTVRAAAIDPSPGSPSLWLVLSDVRLPLGCILCMRDRRLFQRCQSHCPGFPTVSAALPKPTSIAETWTPGVLHFSRARVGSGHCRKVRKHDRGPSKPQWSFHD
jgi:hypothetical protein